MSALQMTTILVGVGTLVLTLELIRRNRLRADHALPWLFVAAIVIILGAVPQLIPLASRMIGVHYPPTLLLTVGLFLSVLMLLFQGMTISEAVRRNRDLAQQIALLRWQIEWVQEELVRLNAPGTYSSEPHPLSRSSAERK